MQIYQVQVYQIHLHHDRGCPCIATLLRTPAYSAAPKRLRCGMRLTIIKQGQLNPFVLIPLMALAGALFLAGTVLFLIAT